MTAVNASLLSFHFFWWRLCWQWWFLQWNERY